MPPRRRRGPAKTEPAALSSRAHEHYKYPSKLIRELFRLFLASTLQNTAAAPLEPRQARPHRRTPSSALPCPQSTSPIAPPHSRAAHGQLLLAQNSPETLAAIEPPPPTRLLASRHRYSSPRPRFRALEGASWTPLAPTPLSPRHRRPPRRDLAHQPPPPSLTTARDLPVRIQETPGCCLRNP